MKKEKSCKHCGEYFTPRRKNHLYCTSSCKTLASYKRNRYKYSPGHYEKDSTSIRTKEKGLSIPADLESKLSTLTDKIEKLSVKSGSENINTGSVTNAAIGVASANALTYGVQKMFAPQMLPATKQDIANLKSEMNEIKLLLKNLNLKNRNLDTTMF
ncbi:MAG TPA: hypothetical protein C5S50_00635 [Methanosarcinaceae archaeon]|nr:hypothetical protein [Methanosarcinaceae archaeon]